MIQGKIEEKKPISICGFRQNCYKIGTSGGLTAMAKHIPEQKTYFSLEKKTLRNGFVEELVSREYPINSESVTSYADGADYRNDPAQAVANAPQRVNLGDITEAQEFLSNPQNFMRIYNETRAKLAAYQKEQVAKQALDSEKKSGESVKEENK